MLTEFVAEGSFVRAAKKEKKEEEEDDDEISSTTSRSRQGLGESTTSPRERTRTLRDNKDRAMDTTSHNSREGTMMKEPYKTTHVMPGVVVRQHSTEYRHTSGATRQDASSMKGLISNLESHFNEENKKEEEGGGDRERLGSDLAHSKTNDAVVFTAERARGHGMGRGVGMKGRGGRGRGVGMWWGRDTREIAKTVRLPYSPAPVSS